MNKLMCHLGFHNWLSYLGVRSCIRCRRKETKLYGYWAIHVETERTHEDNL